MTTATVLMLLFAFVVMASLLGWASLKKDRTIVEEQNLRNPPAVTEAPAVIMAEAEAAGEIYPAANQGLRMRHIIWGVFWGNFFSGLAAGVLLVIWRLIN